MEKVIHGINLALIANCQIACPNTQTFHLRAQFIAQENFMTRSVKVQETLRRRPRRLLSVLCTFNRRPLFKGIFLQPRKQI